MEFVKHNNLVGSHAVFSPSQASWLRYDDEKLKQVFLKRQAAQKGTLLHEWAKQTIDLGIKQPKSKKTLYSYVNDAIGFKMSTEVVLYYSDYFYGTADAISFRYINGRGFLRIHDLKTGENPVTMEQLKVYAALFCLEYKIKPTDIDMELRIYQNDEILYYNPEADEILQVMDIIIRHTKILQNLEYGEV